MSQQNVDAFGRAIDAFNRRDVEALMTILDPECEFRPLLAGVREAPYRGQEGVSEWLAATDEVFEFFRLENERLEDHGDFVIAVSDGLARGKASGAEIRRTFVQIAEFRNGKCVWWQTFQTRADALEAAGLSE